MAQIYHSGCSWWSSYDTDISKAPGVSFHNWAEPSATAFIGVSSEVPALPSRANPQLFSLPLQDFKTSITQETLTRPSSAARISYNLSHFQNTVSVCWNWGNTSQKILPQWYCLLLNHCWFFSPSWWATIIPAKQSYHVSSSGILFITANPPTHKKNHKFLTQKDPIRYFLPSETSHHRLPSSTVTSKFLSPNLV